MGVDLDALAKKSATATMTIGDDEADVKYNPHAVTLELIGRFEEAANDVDSLSGILSEIVIWWDVTKNKKNLKPTAANMRTMPMSVLTAAMQAIQEDAMSGEAGTHSNAG